jgi:transcriptional regulator with XRE-family HTH domain
MTREQLRRRLEGEGVSLLAFARDLGLRMSDYVMLSRWLRGRLDPRTRRPFPLSPRLAQLVLAQIDPSPSGSPSQVSNERRCVQEIREKKKNKKKRAMEKDKSHSTLRVRSGIEDKTSDKNGHAR